MAVDVAVTNSKTSDSSAFTIGCIDPNNNKYVKKSAAKKLLSNDLLEQTLKYARDYECMEIGIEDSAVSKTFIENLQDAIYIRNLPYVITKLKPNGRNKEARIQQYILSAMNQNRLYFIDKVEEDLRSEAINFPNAIHDDGLDSLAYFIEMGNNLLSRSGTITNAINPIPKSRRTAINGNTNNVY
jgi:phage terminase large subunit-like protein